MLLYYEAGGRRLGPFAPEEIVDLVSRGVLSPKTNVFDAKGHPQPASDISGVLAARREMPPPPPLPSLRRYRQRPLQPVAARRTRYETCGKSWTSWHREGKRFSPPRQRRARHFAVCLDSPPTAREIC